MSEPASTSCCAREAPLCHIAENSGVEGSIVVGKVNENRSQTHGFDARTDEYVDLLHAGIVDPAKVVCTAFQEAASVAGLLITTEARVAEAPKKRLLRQCPETAERAARVAWTSNPHAAR